MVSRSEGDKSVKTSAFKYEKFYCTNIIILLMAKIVFKAGKQNFIFGGDF